MVTEATLALVLFADASTVRLNQLGHDVGLPLRLLGIGLPLTFLLGTLAGNLLLGAETWAVAALLAAILAPTDAALSLPVVTNPAVPSRVRRMLNVESGLNDGIVTPVVTVLLAVVAAEEDLRSGWVTEAVGDIGIAVLVAVLVGGLGGCCCGRAQRGNGPVTCPRSSPYWPWLACRTSPPSGVAGTASLPRSPRASSSQRPPATASVRRPASLRPSGCSSPSWCGGCSALPLSSRCCVRPGTGGWSSTPS